MTNTTMTTDTTRRPFTDRAAEAGGRVWHGEHETRVYWPAIVMANHAELYCRVIDESGRVAWGIQGGPVTQAAKDAAIARVKSALPRE